MFIWKSLRIRIAQENMKNTIRLLRVVRENLSWLCSKKASLYIALTSKRTITFNLSWGKSSGQLGNFPQFRDVTLQNLPGYRYNQPKNCYDYTAYPWLRAWMSSSIAYVRFDMYELSSPLIHVKVSWLYYVSAFTRECRWQKSDVWNWFCMHATWHKSTRYYQFGSNLSTSFSAD